jgi:hypothetical protein
MSLGCGFAYFYWHRIKFPHTPPFAPPRPWRFQQFRRLKRTQGPQPDLSRDRVPPGPGEVFTSPVLVSALTREGAGHGNPITDVLKTQERT